MSDNVLVSAFGASAVSTYYTNEFLVILRGPDHEPIPVPQLLPIWDSATSQPGHSISVWALALGV